MVRVEVARALAVFRSQESLPELRELLDDPVGEVRAQALLSLVDLEDRSSLPQIRSMVTDDCPEVRAGVAKAIGQLKDTESVPLLLDLVSNGSKVAIAAADSLKIMQVREAIPTLIPLLSHRVPEVRAKALEVLGDFGAVEAEPKIRELLQDPDERVRQAAQSAILAFPSKDTEEKILAELQKPTTQENLRLAIKSVVKMRGAEAIPLLISVSRPDADEALAEALKSLGVERSVKDLIQRVVSSDPDKRDQMTRDASRILKILGVKEIWPSLRTAVLSGDSETASGVGVLLSDMAQDWQIGEQIRNVFPDPDPRVSVLLAEALSDAGRRDMSGSLLELMKDPNPDISLRAAVCLGASGQNPVPIKVDILIIQALQDQDPGRRTRAAKAAGHARVYRSSDRLMEMAEKDPDSSVRSSAAKALEMLVSR